jgi:hypothetical protein
MREQPHAAAHDHLLVDRASAAPRGRNFHFVSFTGPSAKSNPPST